jgi:ubiquinone/menaquinone biosynthesis C-methylase UbiE
MTADEALLSAPNVMGRPSTFAATTVKRRFCPRPPVLSRRTSLEAAAVDKSNSVGLISLYRKRAKWYDRSALLLYFAGFRHWSYRKRAIQSLALNHGDTVVDLGCGTGLNFSLLQEQVGPRGRIIGVDLTDAMLDQANARIAAHDWSNVELVKSDAATYVFPRNVDGILSTFALTLVPEFDEVIRNGVSALLPGKRFVILDFKRPFGWFLDRAAPPLAKLLTGPFGGTIEMASRKPFQSLDKYLNRVEFTNLYFGGAYIAAGERASSPAGKSRGLVSGFGDGLL